MCVCVIQWSVLLYNFLKTVASYVPLHALYFMILLLQNVMRIFLWAITNRIVLLKLQNVCTNAPLTAVPHYRLLLLISAPWNVHERLLQCRHTYKSPSCKIALSYLCSHLFQRISKLYCHILTHTSSWYQYWNTALISNISINYASW